jgi:hypothetical protein
MQPHLFVGLYRATLQRPLRHRVWERHRNAHWERDVFRSCIAHPEHDCGHHAVRNCHPALPHRFQHGLRVNHGKQLRLRDRHLYDHRFGVRLIFNCRLLLKHGYRHWELGAFTIRQCAWVDGQ